MPLVADFDGYSWNQQVFGKPQMMRIKNLTTKEGMLKVKAQTVLKEQEDVRT